MQVSGEYGSATLWCHPGLQAHTCPTPPFPVPHPAARTYCQRAWEHWGTTHAHAHCRVQLERPHLPHTRTSDWTKWHRVGMSRQDTPPAPAPDCWLMPTLALSCGPPLSKPSHITHRRALSVCVSFFPLSWCFTRLYPAPDLWAGRDRQA